VSAHLLKESAKRRKSKA
jgi:hypothetical protein